MSACPAIHYRPEASCDIDEIAAFVSGGDFSVGYRFYAAVHGDIEQLSVFPGLGPLCGFAHPGFLAVRSIPVTKFQKYLIFYRPLQAGGVEVMRVIYGARDVREAPGTF